MATCGAVKYGVAYRGLFDAVLYAVKVVAGFLQGTVHMYKIEM